VRDIARITGYTIGRIWHYGHPLRSYRAGHAQPPCIVDPPSEETDAARALAPGAAR